jgi:hypothetical protein
MELAFDTLFEVYSEVFETWGEWIERWQMAFGGIDLWLP